MSPYADYSPAALESAIKRGAQALKESFQVFGYPGTRMPGTESVDCEEAARIVLTAALDLQ